MKIFSWLYDKMLSWSAHQHAHYYLAGVSFVESSFFPIPPEVMLISMGLATPKRSWQFALIATLSSVAGGVLGYLIGLYAMSFIQSYLLTSTYATCYQMALKWFQTKGVWVIIMAGIIPIPYKIFTITAGALQMPLLPFMVGSLISRGTRFYLVSGLLYFTGERLEAKLRRWIDWMGWIFLIGAALAYIIYLLY